MTASPVATGLRFIDAAHGIAFFAGALATTKNSLHFRQHYRIMQMRIILI